MLFKLSEPHEPHEPIDRMSRLQPINRATVVTE